MKRTSPGSFTTVVEPSLLPAGLPQLGEPIVGLYRNPPPWEHTSIVLTLNGCGSFVTPLVGSNSDHLTSLRCGRAGASGFGTAASA